MRGEHRLAGHVSFVEQANRADGQRIDMKTALTPKGNRAINLSFGEGGRKSGASTGFSFQVRRPCISMTSETYNLEAFSSVSSICRTLS